MLHTSCPGPAHPSRRTHAGRPVEARDERASAACTLDELRMRLHTHTATATIAACWFVPRLPFATATTILTTR